MKTFFQCLEHLLTQLPTVSARRASSLANIGMRPVVLEGSIKHADAAAIHHLGNLLRRRGRKLHESDSLPI